MDSVKHTDLAGDDLHGPYHRVGTADPGAIGPGKFWLDTTGGRLVEKRRNPENTGWQTVGAPPPVLTALAIHYGQVSLPASGFADVSTLNVSLTLVAGVVYDVEVFAEVDFWVNNVAHIAYLAPWIGDTANVASSRGKPCGFVDFYGNAIFTSIAHTHARTMTGTGAAISCGVTVAQSNTSAGGSYRSGHLRATATPRP